MAKSNSFFSIRRGSTKSHTYSGWQGQQVTKDRVVNVKNPRSASQQAQRMKFAAVGNFYKYLKFILNHSWEGVTYGVNSYNKFMSENVKNFDTSSMIIPEFGSKVAEAGTYKVSEGSLPVQNDATDVENFAFSFLARSSAAGQITVGDIRGAWFDKGNPDYITIVGLYSTVEPDGSPNVNYQTKGFALRLHNPSEADATAITTANFATLFAPEYVGISSSEIVITVDTSDTEALGTVTIKAGTSTGELAIDTGIYVLCYGVIGSKKSNDSWLRSNCILSLTDDVTSLVATSNAANIASWPTGADYILNGEATAVIE